MNLKNIASRQAHALTQQGQAVIVDVRDHSEWRSGHIPGAKHIPLHELPDRLKELPDDCGVIFQCVSGARSAMAAQFAAQNGFASVFNLAQGILGWRMAGLPLEEAP